MQLVHLHKTLKLRKTDFVRPIRVKTSCISSKTVTLYASQIS